MTKTNAINLMINLIYCMDKALNRLHRFEFAAKNLDFLHCLPDVSDIQGVIWPRDVVRQ